MGEKIKDTGNEIRERWVRRMPRFFRMVVTAACGLGGLVFTLNTVVPALGGVMPEWWTEIYTHILSGCVGVVFACKFTVAGGYKEIDPDKLLKDKETE